MADNNNSLLWLAGAVVVALAYWQRDTIKEGVVMAGEYLKPRGIRNNNPGNLKRNGIKWEGLSEQQTDAVFYQFITPDYGIRALAKDLKNDYFKDGTKTIRGLITEFAPGIENNTIAYINTVCKAVGKGPDEVLSFPADFKPLISAIIKHENGQQPYSMATIDNGLRLAGVA